MTIQELQKRISEIFFFNLERDNLKRTEDYLFLKLWEEFWELLQAFLIHKKLCRPEKFIPEEESKKHLKKEFADVMWLLFSIAEKLDIDIEESLDKKRISKERVMKK